MDERTPDTSRARDGWRRLILLIGLCALLGLMQFPVLNELAYQWRDPDAGHGVLAPFLALLLVWRYRERITASFGPASAWGLAVIFVSLVPRIAGIMLAMPFLDRFAVILGIWGVIMTVYGVRAAIAASLPVAFLLTAIPLPGRVQTILAQPLQEFATRATEYLLIASGIQLQRFGNVIAVQDYQIAVAEACNGLRMLLAYAMIGLFFALFIRRPWWDRVLMILAIVPVALAANIIRIYATALIVIFGSEEAAATFFHDIAGYVMMPVAVLMLMLLLWISGRVYVVDRLGTKIAGLDSLSTVALEKN
jgi:exosortase